MKGTIVIIGFGPYAKYKSNMSAKIAKSLNGISFSGYNVKGHIIPVEYMTLEKKLDAILKKPKPKILLFVNITKTSKFLLEKSARNQIRGFYNDTSVTPQKIVRRLDLNFEYTSTLPLKVLHEALTIDKVKVKINKKPSTFIGNHAFFYSMHILNQKKPKKIPIGLIHIPDKNQSLMNLIGIFDRIFKEIIEEIEKE